MFQNDLHRVMQKSHSALTQLLMILCATLLCTIRVAKTKALISFEVTAKLICVFVFAYADCWFSHDGAYVTL